MSGLTLSTQDSTGSNELIEQGAGSAIATQLADRIGSARFNLWFSRKSFACNTNESSPTVLVYAETKFSLQRIQNSFGQAIRQVVDRVAGPQFELQYLVSGVEPSGKESPAEQSGDGEASQAKQNAQPTVGSVGHPQAISINDKRSERPENPSGRKHLYQGVNSFWFGERNQLVQTGVAQLFEQPGQFSPLFIYGSTGSGKTHLLEALTNDFRRRLKKKRCVFLSAEQFTSQFVGSLRGGSGLPMFRRKYRDLDLLAIDDIQFLAGKRATLGEFQHTIDNLIRTGKQVVVSSDRPPIELGHLGNDISARLSAGLTCPLEYPDFEGRLHIVKRMCAQRNFKLPVSVMRLVCEQLTRDVRRLYGGINRLFAYSISTGKPVTPEVAQKVLQDLFSLSGPNCTSMVSIEQAVCEFCGIEPNELKSSSRRKKICAARMLAMYLSRQYTASAFSEIGDYFGGRSHSTVIAAERKVANWIRDDEGIAVSNSVYQAKEVLRRIESNLRIG